MEMIIFQTLHQQTIKHVQQFITNTAVPFEIIFNEHSLLAEVIPPFQKSFPEF